MIAWTTLFLNQLCVSQNKFKDSVREKYLGHNDQAFFIINWYMENVNDSMRLFHGDMTTMI